MIKYTVGFSGNGIDIIYVGKNEEGNLEWTEDLMDAILFDTVEDTRILRLTFNLCWLPVYFGEFNYDE